MKKGFTLAEVLITLGVIGIVATLTMPTLIQNGNKKSYGTALAKAYNVFNQAMLKARADEAVDDIADTAIMKAIRNDGYIGSYVARENSEFTREIKKIFNVVKVCPRNSSCTRSSYKTLGNLKDEDGNYIDFRNSVDEYYYIITPDGITFYLNIYPMGLAVGDEVNVKLKNGKIKRAHGWVAIDVNGPDKPPNVNGRDLFWFILGNDGALYPEYGMEMLIL